jgi:hypothetical protein
VPLFAALRFPCSRVLLPRTRLAYIHLRNLLNDAKRDRAARVSGYVAVWLTDELLTLYLLRGELVNATVRDARGSQALALSRALEKVPPEPEYGEICFHEADEEQLACMFTSQTAPPTRWPSAFAVGDPSVLFPYLMSMTFDGMLEIVADDTVNYLSFRNGTVARAFLSAGHHGTVIDRVAKLFAREGRVGELAISRWDTPPPLPVQAQPALVQAYRELASSLVQRLVDGGSAGAPAIAEHARQSLVATHPVLDTLTFSGRPARDAVADTAQLTAGVAAWTKELLWTAMDHDGAPDQILRDLTWDRRHIFQSAGLYEQLPWKVI